MNPSIQELQAVNERLKDLLDRMGQVPSHPEGIDGSRIADLLNTVLQAGECLRAQSEAVPDPEWQRQTQAYRTNLERLRGLLPLLEVQLRMERARLESERSHLHAASEWITSSRQTM